MRVRFAIWPRVRLRTKFEVEQDRLADQHEALLRTDVTFMPSFLEEQLKQVSWPRETSVLVEILLTGRTVLLDVDLPEIEHLPLKAAVTSKNSRRLLIKEISAIGIREQYARHIHGVGFRLAGMVFSLLPVTERCVISGYSQRVGKQTGLISTEYLYSVIISREEFSRMNFENLSSVDPVEALGIFEIRRSMTKTGILKPIQPFRFVED